MIVCNIHDIDIENGSILLVDKPLRWTSFDVVNKIKHAVKQEWGIKKFKIGHAGTLDPLATGLLIVCVGKYTKQISLIQDLPKTYRGTLVLGATTLSCDLEHQPENFKPYEHLTDSDLEGVKKLFTGDIMQVPPVFSAVRVEGRRAFDLARKGQDDVPLTAKQIHIYRFELTRIALPEVDFEIQCSKGTYIRAIARDIGEKLGCGAYLSALRRTQIGDFSLEHPFSFEELMLPDRPRRERKHKKNFEL